MNHDRSNCPRASLSRRSFLQGTAATVGGLATGSVPARSRAEIEFAPGTFPTHRVVRAHDPESTGWNWSSDYYFDFVDQARINRMVDEAVRVLVGLDGRNAEVRAWKRIMASFQAGDRVAIKVNCNNSANLSNTIDATPPVIIPVIRALVEYCKVPAKDIFVYDVARALPRARLQDRIPFAVQYVSAGHPLAEADPQAKVIYRNIGPQYMPLVLTQAQHLINLPLFKNHAYVLSTMAFKNHFGTTRPGPSNLHQPITQNLADLNAGEHIRGKTRLLLADALWGIWTGGPSGKPQKWDTFPGGPNPNSVFAATDPVAHESVMVDYLIAEKTFHGENLLSHDHLHDAMAVYGLGIHEHRDEHGRYRQIDYLQVDTSRPGSARITVR